MTASTLFIARHKSDVKSALAQRAEMSGDERRNSGICAPNCSDAPPFIYFRDQARARIREIEMLRRCPKSVGNRSYALKSLNGKHPEGVSEVHDRGSRGFVKKGVN